jgi:hypothetical protein
MAEKDEKIKSKKNITLIPRKVMEIKYENGK